MTTKHLFTIFYCIISLVVSGQSISGNVSSLLSEINLGFANVNIYKNGKLVANVMTDAAGNFNVKLDTGVYNCEINYAGFKKVSKEIKVSKDEKADFSLGKDEKSKYSAIEMERYVIARENRKVDMRNGIFTSNMWGTSRLKDSANYGKLTAGEINDFSKWNLWTDLTKHELNLNQQSWNFAPTNRYTLQLTDQNGLPLANATIELIKGHNVIFTTKSDNTGKAELWESLNSDSVSIISATSIKVNYYGKTKTIRNAKQFDMGINTVVLNTECLQSQNIDIAIVVDATGSMQDEIDYLKFDINQVIYQSKALSSSLNFRFANVFYRDNGDTYITEKQDFTSILSESVAFINNHKADGGGDEPESVEIALNAAINELSWGKDTRSKILFLVLDAPPHNTPEVRKKMIDLCYQAAEKGIRIVPVTGSSSNKNNEYLMRCIALATNGTYLFLTNHSGIGNSHLNPSTDHYQVEILNDLLVRVIKSYTYMPDCKQNIADLGVNLPDSQIIIPNRTDHVKYDSSKIDPTLKDTVMTSAQNSIHTSDSIEFRWKFYPNPTNGIINIVSNKSISELYISDLSGKVLQLIRNIQPEIAVTADLTEFASGIYLIRYSIGKQWISGKIMLVRK